MRLRSDSKRTCLACGKTGFFWQRDYSLYCPSCGMTVESAKAFAGAAQVTDPVVPDRRAFPFVAYLVFSWCLMMLLGPLTFGAYASATGTPTWQLMTELWVFMGIGFLPLAFGVRCLHRWLIGGAGIVGRIIAGLLCAGIGIFSAFGSALLWSAGESDALLFSIAYICDTAGAFYLAVMAFRGLRRTGAPAVLPDQANLSPPSVPVVPVAGATKSVMDSPAREVDPTSTIERLKKLLDMGAITQEEYATKKRDLLDRL